jgi:hypothetical protein
MLSAVLKIAKSGKWQEFGEVTFRPFSPSWASLYSTENKQEKAPQVGLEPTTLRLTEGCHILAGSCGLLLIHSSLCFYRFFRVANFNNILLRLAGFCILQTANKRQAVNRRSTTFDEL